MNIIQNRNKLSRIFLFLIISSLILCLLYVNRSKLNLIITPFGIGLLITYILEPVVSFLTHRGMNRGAAVGIIYFILTGIIVIALFYIVPVLFQEINNMVEIIPLYMRYIQGLTQDFNLRYKRTFPLEIQRVAYQNVYQLRDTLYLKLDNMLKNIISVVANLLSVILGPILGFYILKDLDKIKKSIRAYIPNQYRDDVMYWLNKIDKTLGLYIRSQLTVCVIIGVLTTTALFALRVDFALLIGLIAGISNIIPYFGPLIGALPAVAVATLRYPQKIVWILVLTFIIHEIESGIISPYILGENVGLHPLIVILSLLVGGTFFGLWGLILAVPFTVLIKLSIIREIHE